MDGVWRMTLLPWAVLLLSIAATLAQESDDSEEDRLWKEAQEKFNLRQKPEMDDDEKK